MIKRVAETLEDSELDFRDFNRHGLRNIAYEHWDYMRLFVLLPSKVRNWITYRTYTILCLDQARPNAHKAEETGAASMSSTNAKHHHYDTAFELPALPTGS